MMIEFAPIATDVVAIAILAYGLYFRRYYRRDLLLAYVSLNVGVLAVTAVLLSAAVGIGLGFGLFGVLSIIRLRSDTVTQEEIAYYFVALALGLLGGVHTAHQPLMGPALSAALLLVMYVFDHPRLFRRVRRQIVTMDRAYADERVLRDALSRLFGPGLRHFVVLDLDLVRDVTKVDVRYRIPKQGSARRVDGVQPWPARVPR
jgi:Domain of unknown function (DUF4956)